MYKKNKLLLDLSLTITWAIVNKDESDPYCAFDESTKGAKRVLADKFTLASQRSHKDEQNRPS